MLYLLLALLFTTDPGPPPAHDYHISKTNVRYVADRGQVQVEMHLFVDDLEAALLEAGAPKLFLGTQREHDEATRYLTAYLARHFRVVWNETDLPLELIGYELAEDMHGFWCYLAAPAAGEPATVRVTNTLLTESYPDQRNIVKLYRGQERRATLLLSRDRPTESYAE